MFEKKLKNKFEKIFGMRATYDLPSEGKEQERIFISIESSRNKVTHGSESAKVQGVISIFGNSDKLNFGYITKCINNADFKDTSDLFFYNIENNSRYYGNLVERRAGFIYLYKGDYDPNQGEIREIDYTSHIEE